METPIGKYTSKHTNRNVAFGKTTTREIEFGEKTSSYELENYKSGNINLGIQIGKYKSNKIELETIQIEKY